MFISLTENIRLFYSYIVFGFRAQSEYKTAFLLEILTGFLFNIGMIGLFTSFYSIFPLPNGWKAGYYAALWAIGILGLGIARLICFNSFSLSQIIVNGQLDNWLIYPKPPFFHILISNFNFTYLANIASAYIIFITFFNQA